MQKSTLSFLAAGVLAVTAGLAQAEILVTPAAVSVPRVVASTDGSAIANGHTMIVTNAPGGGQTYWIDTPVLTGVAPTTQSVAMVNPLDTTVLGAGPSTVVHPAGVPLHSSITVQTHDPAIVVPAYTVRK